MHVPREWPGGQPETYCIDDLSSIEPRLIKSRTASFGLSTFLRFRFGLRITTIGAADDRAWGAGQPCSDSAFGGASGWFASRPIAWWWMRIGLQQIKV